MPINPADDQAKVGDSAANADPSGEVLNGPSAVDAELASGAAPSRLLGTLLGSPAGATATGTASRDTVQSHLDSMGWFAPDADSSTLARAFQTLRQDIVGDGETDNTGAISEWETAAENHAAGGRTIQTPHLVLGPMEYALGSISKKSFGWRGQGADNTRLVFRGRADDDFITQDIGTGRNSAALLADMSIDGGNCANIYKVPKNSAGYGWDDRNIVRGVRFVHGINQVYVDAWVNGRGVDIRHENWSGYALVLVPDATRNNQSYFEWNCTFDTNVGEANAALGVIKIDLTNLATSGNCGIIKFAGKRWELNQHALGGNKALIDIYTTSGSSRQCEIVLDGIPIQNSVSGGVDALFCRTADGSLSAERYDLRNVQMAGITALFKGDYPAWMIAIPAANWFRLTGDPVNGFIGQRTLSNGATGLEFFGPTSNTVIRQSLVPGEGFARVQDRPDVLLSGTGSVAPAVLLRYGGKTGWGVPTGTLTRTTFSAGISAGASVDYVPAELDSALLRIAGLEERLAALINDIHGSGANSPHGLLRS